MQGRHSRAGSLQRELPYSGAPLAPIARGLTDYLLPHTAFGNRLPCYASYEYVTHVPCNYKRVESGGVGASSPTWIHGVGRGFR